MLGHDPQAFAADGFPLDAGLQKQARRATYGYCLLAGYYVAVLPIVLSYVRWGSTRALLTDVTLRGGVLVSLLAHVAINLLFAYAAWHIVSMRRWTSAAVVAAAGAFTVWAVGSLAWSLGKTVAIGPVGISTTLVPFILLAGYIGCFVALWHPVRTYNRRRWQALEATRGRINGRGLG